MCGEGVREWGCVRERESMGGGKVLERVCGEWGRVSESGGGC